MDYFETITLARQFLPIKMRVLRKGFHNFVRRVQREAAAAASVRQRRRGRGHRRLPDHESEAIVEALTSHHDVSSEAVSEWGVQVDEVFQVYLFTTYGDRLQSLNDVSSMMINAGFAQARAWSDLDEMDDSG